MAKDLALAGVKSLSLHDPKPCEAFDMAAHFYVGEEDIGKSRAEVSASRLSDLNPHTRIEVLEGMVGIEDIGTFNLVICTDSVFGECVQVDDACRALGIKFIMAQTRGVFGSIFVDLGDNFTVYDDNGENPAMSIVSGITRDSPGVVSLLEDVRHGLEDGDYVTFTDVQGMTELNGCEPVEIKTVGPYAFSIGDTSKMSAHTNGGYFKQVKMPKLVDFKNIRQSLLEPEFVTSDFAKMDRERQLLVGFQALDAFFVEKGAYPRPGAAEDQEEVLRLARQFNSRIETQDGELLNTQHVDEVDEKLLRTLSDNARGELCPVMAVIGSIVAQEAMKAISGKFMPIKQWFMFDCTEVSSRPNPPSVPPPPPSTLGLGSHFFTPAPPETQPPPSACVCRRGDLTSLCLLRPRSYPTSPSPPLSSRGLTWRMRATRARLPSSARPSRKSLLR